MRWDRTISLTVGSWGCKLRSAIVGSADRSVERLPILMYHSISDSDERGIRDYYRLCTPPAIFRRHMEVLRENGWVGVDLETGLSWLRSDSGRRMRPVVITFDDGFRDFYTEALPVLREFAFSATMYLATNFVGDEGHRRSFQGTECMTWTEVREACVGGVQFGAHTLSHAKLYGMPWPRIHVELRDSRAEIEDRAGTPATAFAYPYAFPEIDKCFCARLRDELAAAGYRTCVTTIVGRVAEGNDPFQLRRLPVNGSDDASLLLAKLAGAYDWLRVPQRITKRLKSLRTTITEIALH